MPLQATSGAASYDGFGGGVAAVPNYIEDVFSTYLYTGNGSSVSITNGIDLSKYGGMSWIKDRTSGLQAHRIGDTVRGGSKYLASNTTSGNGTDTQFITAFSTNGLTVGAGSEWNNIGDNFVSWTFRKQPKFFDVVTYTGNGVTGAGGGRLVSHSLGSTPGFIIVKRTDSTGDWFCSSRQTGSTDYIASDSFYSSYFCLNRTSAGSGMPGSSIVPNTTQVDVAMMDYTQSLTNINGASYVMYLFAHNAGGFGLTGTDNVISCGSFTTDGSGLATVNLGYEPQWILYKSSSSVGNWRMLDTMRGLAVGDLADAYLSPNLSNAESTGVNLLSPSATGFYTDSSAFPAATTYIYIAIRRGPMKVPTSGTSVFSPVAANNAQDTINTTGFPVDLQIQKIRNAVIDNYVVDRLRGVSSTYTSAEKLLITNSTAAETANTSLTELWNNTGFGTPIGLAGSPVIYWNFGRAPNFFDEVCYTGTGSARTVTHNLGVAPELMIVRNRPNSGGYNWTVYSSTIGPTKALYLNDTLGGQTYSGFWNDTAPTSSVFTVGIDGGVNANTSAIVAYLFATCPNVSKVGTYTGNGTTQTINCGFTSGARFVLIKRTNATGDWYVYDTARGMTTLTDPYLLLNTTAAESATLGSVTTVSTGFAVNSSILAAINLSGSTYTFLAIA